MHLSLMTWAVAVRIVVGSISSTMLQLSSNLNSQLIISSLLGWPEIWGVAIIGINHRYELWSVIQTSVMSFKNVINLEINNNTHSGYTWAILYYDCRKRT